MKERRYDIDWLRVVATLAIFAFHCSRFFDTEGWELKNAEQSLVVDVLRVGLVWQWVMQLFFLLSGVGSWYALRSRTAPQYLLERVKRLVVPLYTVGLVLLLPPQFFFDLVTNKGYTGTFWESIPRYIAASGRSIPNAWLYLSQNALVFPLPAYGHLWFLPYLFLISLVSLPLLLYLRSERGLRWIERLARWSDRRGGMFLFVIPMAIVLVSLRFRFRSDPSWPDLLYYAVFFLVGYILPADERFTETFERHGRVCLALWIVGFAVAGAFILALGYSPGDEPFSVMYALFQIVMSVTSWSAVVFMLSLGAKHLNHTNKALAYATEAVLPFYLLHQTVILIVGWFVIGWDMGIVPKYLIVAVVSFALIMALYELIIRRFNVVRFLFGMRPKRRLPAAPPANSEGIAA